MRLYPLMSFALHAASLPPENAIFLTDTVEGIHVARAAETHPFLMMNDPDEAQRLATYNPAGGVVSCVEKLKVMSQNFRELQQLAQDALEDAVLMGCDEAQVRSELARMVGALQNPYKGKS